MTDTIISLGTDVKFDKALALILRSEGGKVDDKHDNGGRTNQGITQATFSAWLVAQHRQRRDVFNITPSEVSAIYWNGFAKPISFDELPSGVDYAVLDDAVLSGPITAVKRLQNVLGVSPDGVPGVVTLSKARGMDPRKLIDSLCDARLSFFHRLSDFRYFGRGWTNRIDDVRVHAKALCS